MIDINTGAVVFDAFLVLRGGMLVADLPVDHAALAAALDVGGRRLFRLGTHVAAEREWGVAAIFDIRLGEVWLQSLSDALPDWDLRTERIRHETHVEFLKETFAGLNVSLSQSGVASIAFPWGEVTADLDLRGVQAVIRVAYSKT